MSESSAAFRIGVDVGGTFTDIVFLDSEGRVLTRKVSSSVEDYAQAIASGLAQVFDDPHCPSAARIPTCL